MRTVAQIASDIHAAKERFDKRYFTGHNLTAAYKQSIYAAWCVYLVWDIAPLWWELKATEAVEKRIREARVFTHGAGDRGYYVAKYAGKLIVGRG